MTFEPGEYGDNLGKREDNFVPIEEVADEGTPSPAEILEMKERAEKARKRGEEDLAA